MSRAKNAAPGGAKPHRKQKQRSDTPRAKKSPTRAVAAPASKAQRVLAEPRVVHRASPPNNSIPTDGVYAGAGAPPHATSVDDAARYTDDFALLTLRVRSGVSRTSRKATPGVCCVFCRSSCTRSRS
jgi:hypothetical protein